MTMTGDNGHGLISRAVTLLASASLTVGGVCAFAEATYDATTIPDSLIVTVASGTESLDADQVTSNITNIYKRGVGTLTASGLSAYAGDITVEAGVWKYTTADGVGKLDSAGSVYVKNGGTLSAEPTAVTALHLGDVKKVYFEGPGATGQKGALAYPVNRSEDSKSADAGQMFGKNLIMTGDATFYCCNYYYAYGVRLDMGGHQLTLVGRPVFSTGFNVVSPGFLIMKSGQVDFKSTADFGGGSANVFDAQSNTIIAFGNLTKPFLWSVTNVYGFYSDSGWPTSSHVNEFAGPVHLPKGQKEVLTYYHEGVQFSGKVSGEGGFWLHGYISNPSQNTRWWPMLRLSNPNNDFMGGISGSLGELYLDVNGALPSTGGELALTNSLLKFQDTVGTYALPNARFCATGFPATNNLGVMRVQQGKGAWREKMVKEGPGDLLYDSFVTAPRLDIREGRVRLPAHAPGLIYGMKLFGTPEAARAAMNASRELLTNSIVQSTALAYQRTDSLATMGTDKGWTTNMLATYSGYIWNNSTTSATWSFALETVDCNQLYINDELVIDANDGTKIFFGNATLKPGPNRFELRMYNNNDPWAGPRGGSYKDPPSDLNWKRSFGFAYDPQGRGSHNYADYLKAEDPGDGTLFTAVLPGEETEIGGETIRAQVNFATVSLSAGAVLDFTTNTFYCVENLEGFGIVSNADLTVSEAWTVDAAAIGTSALTVEKSLTFADGAQLRVTDGNCSQPIHARCRFTVCTAKGGITGCPTLTDASRWRLSKSEDGKSLSLDYIPKGCVLIIR